MFTTSSVEIIDGYESETEDCVKKKAHIDVNERVPYILTTRLHDMTVFKKDFHLCFPNNMLELIETESRPKVFHRNRRIQGIESNNIARVERNILKMNEYTKMRLEAKKKNYYDKFKMCKPITINILDVKYTDPVAFSKAAKSASYNQIARQNYTIHCLGAMEINKPIVFTLENTGLINFNVILFNFKINKAYVHSHTRNTFMKFDLNDYLFNTDTEAWHIISHMSTNDLLKNLHKYCCWYSQNETLTLYNKNRKEPLPNLILNYLREPHSCKPHNCNCCCNKNKSTSAISKTDYVGLFPWERYKYEIIRNWCQTQLKINLTKEKPRSILHKLGNALKIKIAMVNISRIEYYLIGRMGCLESYYLGMDRITVADAERRLDRDIQSRGYTSISIFETTVCCWYSRQKFLDNCRLPQKTETLIKSCHTCSIYKCKCCCNPYHRNYIKNIQSVPISLEHIENLNHNQLKILLPRNKDIIASVKNTSTSKISLPKNIMYSIKNLLEADTKNIWNNSLKKRRRVYKTITHKPPEVTKQPLVKRIKTVHDVNAELEKTITSMNNCLPRNNVENLNDSSTLSQENSTISSINNFTSLNKMETLSVAAAGHVGSNFNNIGGLGITHNIINQDSIVETSTTLNNSSIVSSLPLPVVTNIPPAPISALNSLIPNTNFSSTIPSSLSNVNKTNTNFSSKILNHPEVQTTIRSILNQFKNVKLIITAEGVLVAQIDAPIDGSQMSKTDLQMLGNLLAYTQELVKSIQMTLETSPLLNLPENNEKQSMQPISNSSTTESQPLSYTQTCQKTSTIAVLKSSYYKNSLIARLKKGFKPLVPKKKPNMNNNSDINPNQSVSRNQKIIQSNTKTTKNLKPNILTKVAPNVDVPNRGVLFSILKNKQKDKPKFTPKNVGEVVKDSSEIMTPSEIPVITENSLINSTSILNRVQENDNFQNRFISKLWSSPPPWIVNSITNLKQNTAVEQASHQAPGTSKLQNNPRKIAPKSYVNQETFTEDVNNIDWESRIVSNSLILDPSKKNNSKTSNNTPMPLITEVYSLNTRKANIGNGNETLCLSD